MALLKHLILSQCLAVLWVSPEKFTWLNCTAWVPVNQGCRANLGYETYCKTWNSVKLTKKPWPQCWSRRSHNQALFMLEVSPGNQARANNLSHREFHQLGQHHTSQTSSFTSRRSSRVWLILSTPLSPGLHLLVCFPHLFPNGFKTFWCLERPIFFLKTNNPSLISTTLAWKIAKTLHRTRVFCSSKLPTGRFTDSSDRYVTSGVQ